MLFLNFMTKTEKNLRDARGGKMKHLGKLYMLVLISALYLFGDECVGYFVQIGGIYLSISPLGKGHSTVQVDKLSINGVYLIKIRG